MSTPSREVLPAREAGVLAHVTSLPGGNIGAAAKRFIDWVSACGLKVWQTLPVAPVNQSDRSPYNALSAMAGEPGLLDREFQQDSFCADLPLPAPAVLRDQFDAATSTWLEDWALFAAIKQRQAGRPWWEWPEPLRDRDPQALAAAGAMLADAIAQHREEQFEFYRQWQALRAYARARGVKLFGDLPIFVAQDSVDVWASRELFQLTASGHPSKVAGVPPDAFSATGQLWGNPLYDWDRAAADGYAWWVDRLRNAFERFDIVRLDHFRGFEAYWCVDAGAETAARGAWAEGPGLALFRAAHAALGPLALVAEDLGFITPAVHELRRALSLPGMVVLQFAFDGGDDNPYLPANIRPDSVVYTGTHDNDTSRAWFEAQDEERQRRIGALCGFDMPGALIRSALGSPARLAIIPMQDWLGLGAGHRMNCPGTATGNWSWHFSWDRVPDGLAARIRACLQTHQRLPRPRAGS